MKYAFMEESGLSHNVAPLAGAWIEIHMVHMFWVLTVMVAPLAGAWIEICIIYYLHQGISVAPLAGAWIEIQPYPYQYQPVPVAPLAGAWIEMHLPRQILSNYQESLPSRERGLKLFEVYRQCRNAKLSLPSRERGLKLL